MAKKKLKLYKPDIPVRGPSGDVIGKVLDVKVASDGSILVNAELNNEGGEFFSNFSFKGISLQPSGALFTTQDTTESTSDG